MAVFANLLPETYFIHRIIPSSNVWYATNINAFTLHGERRGYTLWMVHAILYSFTHGFIFTSLQSCQHTWRRCLIYESLAKEPFYLAMELPFHLKGYDQPRPLDGLPIVSVRVLQNINLKWRTLLLSTMHSRVCGGAESWQIMSSKPLWPAGPWKKGPIPAVIHLVALVALCVQFVPVSRGSTARLCLTIRIHRTNAGLFGAPPASLSYLTFYKKIYMSL